MKFRVNYLWILTSFLLYFIDIGCGIILTLATIYILIQDKEIEKLEKNKQKEELKYGNK